MIDGYIPPVGSSGPVECRGAMFVMVVVWVMLGVGAFVIWSVMRDLR